MATVNGFRIDMIVDLIVGSKSGMDNDELFGRIRSEPPLTEVGQFRTVTDLYRVISDGLN